MSIAKLKPAWEALPEWKRWAGLMGVLSVLIVAVNVTGPLERSDLRTRQHAAEDRIDQLATIAETTRSVEAQVKAVNEQLAGFERRLVLPGESPMVLQRMARSFSDVDVGQQQVATRAPAEFRDFVAQPLSLRFAGGFDAAMAMVRRIEHDYPWLLLIDRLEIEAPNHRDPNRHIDDPLSVEIDLRILTRHGDTSDAYADAATDETVGVANAAQ